MKRAKSGDTCTEVVESTSKNLQSCGMEHA